MSAWRDYNNPVVDMNLQPSRVCNRCGMPIYFLERFTQNRGFHWVAYEEEGCGGGGQKILKIHHCGS